MYVANSFGGASAGIIMPSSMNFVIFAAVSAEMSRVVVSSGRVTVRGYSTGGRLAAFSDVSAAVATYTCRGMRYV